MAKLLKLIKLTEQNSRLEHLEIKSLEELNEIVLLIERNYPDYSAYKDKIALQRIDMRAKFLLGQRNEALKIAKEFIQKKSRLKNKVKDPNDSNEERFIVDSFQIFNRTGNFSLVKNHYEDFKALTNSFLKELLRLEFYVATIENDLDFSLSGIKKIQSLNKYANPVNESEVKNQKELLGFCHFQMGRVYNGQKNYTLALEHYKNAVEYFKSLEMFYFSTFTHHNLIWILFYNRKWEKFSKEYSECQVMATRYNFSYVLSGLHQMMSEFLKKDMRYNEAISEIEESLECLKASGKIAQLHDIQLFKIELLICLGKIKEAKRSLKKCYTDGELSKKYKERYKRWNKYLNLISHVSNHDSEDQIHQTLESLFTDELKTHPLFLVQTNEISIQDGFKESFMGEALKAYIVEGEEFETFQTELRIKKAIKEKNIPRIEKLCFQLNSQNSSKTMNIFNFASTLLLDCLQIWKRSDYELSKSLLINHKKNLDQLDCDDSLKNPLKAILKSLESSSNYLLDSDYWKKSSIWNQSKWLRWFGPFVKVCDHERVVIDANPSANKFLRFDEPKSLIHLNGKEILGISKRTQLKALLKTLIKNKLNGTTGLGKKEITNSVWGERYNPAIHDARIHTSILRLKALLNADDIIFNRNNEYYLEDSLNIELIENQRSHFQTSNFTQASIIKVLQSHYDQKRFWSSKKEILQEISVSDATIKRELKNLLESEIILRSGSGKATKYSLTS